MLIQPCGFLRLGAEGRERWCSLQISSSLLPRPLPANPCARRHPACFQHSPYIHSSPSPCPAVCLTHENPPRANPHTTTPAGPFSLHKGSQTPFCRRLWTLWPQRLGLIHLSISRGFLLVHSKFSLSTNIKSNNNNNYRIATSFEHLLCSNNSVEHVICIISFCLHKCTTREGTEWSPLKRWRHWGWDKPFTQDRRHPISGVKENETKVHLTPEPKLFSLSVKWI